MRPARRSPRSSDRGTPAPTRPPIISPCSVSRSRSCRPRTFTARSWSATDIGGQTHAFTADCREAAIRFSVGYELNDTVRQAILDLPETAWEQAINAGGADRDGAWVAELTDRLDLSAWPEGSRLIVRRERPHPGAQFTIFDEHGYRHTCFLTDQNGNDIAALELRHRGRARVEDSIRAGKDTGMRNLPHHAFEHNQTWLELSLIAQDLLCWIKLICLTGELATAEPKRLRHRLLHIAGRVVGTAAAPACASKPTGPGHPRSPPRLQRLRAIPTLCLTERRRGSRDPDDKQADHRRPQARETARSPTNQSRRQHAPALHDRLNQLPPTGNPPYSATNPMHSPTRR